MSEPADDAQRRAFTEADDSDWAAQARLMEDAVVHEPGDLTDVRTPDEWHATGWDADREPPKTLAEARAALNARITNPDAPDSWETAGAYDDLGEG